MVESVDGPVNLKLPGDLERETTEPFWMKPDPCRVLWGGCIYIEILAGGRTCLYDRNIRLNLRREGLTSPDSAMHRTFEFEVLATSLENFQIG